MTGAASVPFCGVRSEVIEQAAGTRRVIAAKDLRRRHHGPAETAQQIGAPSTPGSGLSVRHLEAADEPRLR